MKPMITIRVELDDDGGWCRVSFRPKNYCSGNQEALAVEIARTIVPLCKDVLSQDAPKLLPKEVN